MFCRRRFALLAAVFAALLLAGCGGAGSPHNEATFLYPMSGLVPAALSTTTGTGTGVNSPLPRGTSLVAWALARPVSVYSSPRGGRPNRQFAPRDQYGLTQVFLVKRAIPGWLEVYLPVRPNDSTGWVRSASVKLTLNSYRVVIDTAAHELTTFHGGRAVLHTRVGVGTPATPTPHGLFYIVEALKMIPSTGPYGTYAFGLSAHSTVLKTFGTGDAQVALHGTDEPNSIGRNWSNGCVHMMDSIANWMARTLPLGTPVQIS